MSEATKAVFLSYASQDAEAAKRICEALRAAGVEVWFDQSELRGGDAWDQKIRRQIKECALFMPILSANTQARPEGYFRLEWRLADQRTHLMGRNRAFLVPVCVDQTPDTNADIPDSFSAVQWTRLPGGETPPAFVERVKRLLPGETAALAVEPGERTRETGLPMTRPTATAAAKEGNSVAVLAFFSVVVTGASAAASSGRFAEPPVISPIEVGRETRATLDQSPHSSVSARAALAAAYAIASQVPGAQVFTVMPTGSMRPMFDQKAFVVVEPAPYEDLRVGDIITYMHPQLNTPVIHRIMEKDGQEFWTKGDHNARPDNVYVNHKNYRMRVFAVIYARDDSNSVNQQGLRAQN